MEISRQTFCLDVPLLGITLDVVSPWRDVRDEFFVKSLDDPVTHSPLHIGKSPRHALEINKLVFFSLSLFARCIILYEHMSRC